MAKYSNFRDLSLFKLQYVVIAGANHVNPQALQSERSHFLNHISAVFHLVRNTVNVKTDIKERGNALLFLVVSPISFPLSQTLGQFLGAKKWIARRTKFPLLMPSVRV